MNIAGKTQWTRIFLLVLPLLFLFIFFVVPMFHLFIMSLRSFNPTAGIDESVITISNYKKFLTDAYYLNILFRTFKISAFSTFFCFLLGYPVAYLMNISKPRTVTIILLIFISPLLISIVVRSFSWMVLLAPNGVINTYLMKFHIIKKPLKLIWNEFGIFIGLVHVFLSLMILSIFNKLSNINPNLVLAARNLGATQTQAFMKVTFPLSIPGIVAGAILVFSISVSTFITPALLGGARTKVIPYLIYEQNLVLLNWPFGAAISFILLSATFIVIFLYMKLMQSKKWKVIYY